MANCTLCERELSPEQLDHDGICNECVEHHALPPRTEPLRPRSPCARCGHPSFIRARALRERAPLGGDYGGEYIAPLAVTFGTKTNTTFWAGREELRVDSSVPYGVLEAYVCRRCGCVELYAQRPDEIPIGEEHGTEIFDASPDLYR